MTEDRRQPTSPRNNGSEQDFRPPEHGVSPSVDGAAAEPHASHSLNGATERGAEMPPMPPLEGIGTRSGIAAALAEARADDTEAERQQAPTSGRIRRVFWRVFKWGMALGALGLVAIVVAIFFTIRHYESGLPSVEQLREGYRPPQVTRILAGDGTLLANLFEERRTVIDIGTIPPHAKLAFLAAEDASFYEHEGLDYLGMLRALVRNLKAGHTVQGGSTITQQVVKNLLLDSERSYGRKARETILARRLEQHLTKDEIFGLYLNHIYLGHGRYGIEEASRFYFGKHASELGLAEAATLAGIVAAPERYSPRRAPERTEIRRRFVLNQMLVKGFITAQLHDQATGEPLRLAPAAEAESDLAPEVVAWAKKELAEAAGLDSKSGGFTVTTTLNTTLQAAARQAVRDNLDAYSKRHKLFAPYTAKKQKLWGNAFEGAPRKYGIYVGEVVSLDDTAGTIDVRVGSKVGRVFLNHEERYNPKRLRPTQFAEVGAALRVGILEDPADTDLPPLRLELGPQSALVAVDVRTRELVALVGSYEALAGGLDRATRSKRQPGSVFKPFVYSYALSSRRFSPTSIFELPAKGDQVVQKVRLRSALARSLNPVAEQVLQAVGAAQVVQWAHAIGIESDLGATPSLALGAYELSPIELANAYATFATGGWAAPPVVVRSIQAGNGRSIPLAPRPPRRRVMDEDVAYLISSLMRSVVEEGTGRRAQVLRRPVAGKTGTTNQAKDAWFAGYSTDIVTVVWVGYDDALPLGRGESGAVTALPAWVDFMRVAHSGKPATRFPRPPSIVVERIDPETGFIALQDQEDAIEEEFLPGTVPTEVTQRPGDAGTESAVPDDTDDDVAPSPQDHAANDGDDSAATQGQAHLSTGEPKPAAIQGAGGAIVETSPSSNSTRRSGSGTDPQSDKPLPPPF